MVPSWQKLGTRAFPIQHVLSHDGRYIYTLLNYYGEHGRKRYNVTRIDTETLQKRVDMPVEETGEGVVLSNILISPDGNTVYSRRGEQVNLGTRREQRGFGLPSLDSQCAQPRCI